MEARCEAELQRVARPTLEDYWRTHDEAQAAVDHYGEFSQERSRLRSSVEDWFATGEVADELLAAVLEDRYDPQQTGVAPDAMANGETGRSGGEQCAIKDRQYEPFVQQFLGVQRGTNDVCDHHKVNYLAQAWAYDLARVCMEEGVPGFPPDEVEKQRRAMPAMTRHLEQLERRGGCQYDPTLTHLREEWSPIPY